MTVRRPLLRCPSCGLPLARRSGVYACSNNHSFDTARDGYVNLLRSGRKPSGARGDTDEMIRARRRILEAGHFLPLLARVADAVAAAFPDGSDRVLVDAGCGEGYYVRSLRRRLARSSSITWLGIDISKFAVHLAASRDPDSTWVVGSSHDLPVLDHRVDVLLSIFAPIDPAEYTRVLLRSGSVITATPAEGHLAGLRSLIYRGSQGGRDPDPVDVRGLFPAHRADVERIRFSVALNPDEREDMLLMTPFYWQVAEPNRASLAAAIPSKLEADVILSVCSSR